MAEYGMGSLFLKLDGATGEAIEPTHKNEIPVLSFSFSGHAESGSGGTAGSSGAGAMLHGINVTAIMDKGLQTVGKLFCEGKHIATGVLSAMKATGTANKDYFTLKMTQVYIQSFNVNLSNDSAIVNLTLTYAEITPNYFQQQADGSMAATTSYTFNTKSGKTT
ncbi:type VI secretion system tube protein Hcp [Terriglobus saanensis]|uniref:Type VI secretion system effector, Hcp1 family n=1 Tax=Terriglobus saanensis (strain ATCC BAA-1853 / DSM 23119 / SP1PR4) TaxID=401053 RepID=E8UX28_TERSS|nr:type VI secretion system tube protein Hcp [Terriglobus saanensis]ADV81915.1 protein of unknown function DUF796 [Terriglobus saanensis SP1PR4]